jgi:hypothetical protein
LEIDGIPLAGGPASYAALHLRSALSLDDISVVEGPFVSSSALRNAVGGVINLQTPAIGNVPSGGFETGYDSAFGAFQHARFSDSFGRLGVMADALTGAGLVRSQTLKLRYAFAPGDWLGVATYGSQSALGSAPAFAADLRAGLGPGVLQVRSFGSSEQVPGLPGLRERGDQAEFDLQAGHDAIGISYDRRLDAASIAGSTAMTQTYATLRLHGDIQLSQRMRLEVAGVNTGGMGRARNDPQVALTMRAASHLTLRLAAGSAFATEPAYALAIAPQDLRVAPETSFGYRATADASLDPSDHLRLSVFSLQRRDLFAALANGRAAGVEVGFERAPVPGRLGGSAFVALTRSYLYGPAQPAARDLYGLQFLDGAQLDGEPYAKARGSLDYPARSFDLRFGTTLLGANNALATHAVALGDASIGLRVLGALDLRVGLHNMFGVPVDDPVLAPLFPRHEFTVTFGRLGD